MPRMLAAMNRLTAPTRCNHQPATAMKPESGLAVCRRGGAHSRGRPPTRLNDGTIQFRRAARKRRAHGAGERHDAAVCVRCRRGQPSSRPLARELTQPGAPQVTQALDTSERGTIPRAAAGEPGVVVAL